MRSLHRFPLALIASVFALTLTPSTASPQTGDEAPVEARIADELGVTPTSELEILLAPMTVDELSALKDAAIEQLRVLAGELAALLIEQRRLLESQGASPDALTAAGVAVDALLEQKERLASRAELVLNALQAKGGDVESARRYVSVIRGLESTEPAPIHPSQEEPAEDPEREALDQQVSDAIAAIREQPPAHDRPQPWAVPIHELELELKPLRLAQAEGRVEKWLEILQRELQRRIRIDMALAQAEDAEQRTELVSRSARQQEVVRAVVQRLEVVLLVVQRRGGDVAEYKKYIATATGQKLSLTDPGVLSAQAMAWMKSRDGGIWLAVSVLKAVGLLFVFFLLSRVLGRAVSSAISRLPKASALLKSFLVGGTRRITLIIGLVVAVGALGVNVTPLVAAIGAAGLVIGLALQGTLSNFASGILILFYRPFDVGDVINAGGVAGKVDSMSLVSTVIVTADNQVMIVPNNQVWNGVITNVTARDTRRVDLVFGIGYGDDIELAVTLLNEAMTKHEKVLDEPAPVVKVSELADHSVNLIARPWARTSDYWDVLWDLKRTVKEQFDAAGINIPFPQRDLHIPGTVEVRLAST